MSVAPIGLIRTPTGRPYRYLTRSVSRVIYPTDYRYNSDRSELSNHLNEASTTSVKRTKTSLARHLCKCDLCTKSKYTFNINLNGWITLAIFGLFILFNITAYHIYKNYSDVNAMLKKLNDKNISSKKAIDIFENIESAKRKLKYVDNGMNAAVQKISQTPQIIDNMDKNDFALESLGGRVLKVYLTKSYRPIINTFDWIWDKITRFDDSVLKAQVILQPRVIPGECWAFQGSRGIVIIELISNILISGISIEHISVDVSPNKEILSAPRDFNLIGLENELDENGFDFGKFTYNKNGPPLQSFIVEYASVNSYRVVKLEILSNWGNVCFTCIYRVQIHGRLDNEMNNNICGII